MPAPTSRYAMIMAGGAGTRLWPMSRRDRPKQLLPLHLPGPGRRSLLEMAAARLDGAVAPPHRLVCTGEAHRPLVRAALPELADEQILGEPVGRNTVNAVGLTAAVLARRDPDAVFAVLTSDHLIEPADEFRRRLDTAFALVEDDRTRLVTFSITPTFAATGYGWVNRGEPVPGFDGAFRALGFDEKPEAPTAEAYLASSTWGWNSGMFVFHAAQFLESLSWFEPASFDGLKAIGEAWGTDRQQEVLAAVYPTLRADSVDFAVMEPAASDARLTICCVPMNVSWMDVGSWPSYGETIDADEHDCRTNTRTLHLDSTGVLAVSDDPSHTIATIGCRDLIVVHTRDVTMVCPTAEAQRVRALAEKADEDLR